MSEKTLENSFFQKVSLYFWLLARKIDWGIFGIIIMPLMLLLHNESWLFSQTFNLYIDPWIYLGYFLNLKDHLNIFAKAYYGTRLPWILPGALAYRCFSPILATYILHLTFYYAATLSLYLILKQTLGRRVALITTILMGFDTFFLNAIRSNYMDGAGLTYIFLTLLMLTKSADKPLSHLKIWFAGVFFGCAIFTQTFLINYAPLITIYYFFVNRENKTKNHLNYFIKFVLGFLCIMFFLCIINYSLTKTFFFFLPSIQIAKTLCQNNAWWQPFFLWFKKPTYLIGPIIATLTSLGTLIFYRKFRSHSKSQYVWLFPMLFAFIVLFYAYWQFIAKQPVLQLDYYTSYFFPLQFLAFGSLIALITHKIKKRTFYALLITTLTIYSITYSITWSLVPQSPDIQKQGFRSIVKSIRTIQNMDQEIKARFWYNVWYNDGEKLGATVYRAISSAYLWGYRLFNEQFPSVSSKSFCYKLSSDDKIFLITAKDNALELANQGLEEIGLKAELIDEKLIKEKDIQYKLIYLQMREREGDASN